MNYVHRPNFDLNLLKVFDAIMKTRSASQAADALGLSQSAVSHALARLREQIGDPLFVRIGGRMEPTARALRLADPLRDALEAAARIVAYEDSFDPARSGRVFCIAASDSIQASLLGTLLRNIAAPGLRVAVRLLGLERDAALAALDSGDVDVAVGFLPKSRRWHERERLYSETHLCLFDQRLVRLQAPISLLDFVAHPHILPSLRGELTSFVDEALEKHGLQRRVVASTGAFTTIPMMLKSAPVIATLPARVARFCSNAATLTVSPLPFEGPGFDISMVWNRRDIESASHAWLRARIREAAQV
ncbi:MAG: LysR family transcriptional regulator [Acetobacteraceae bacterium]|nr:LysR family transcriptional regulator [Acetobacteraceae bacterium]